MRAVTWAARNVWIAFLTVVVGLVSPTLARERYGERESLAGLAGVYVLVEDMAPDVERNGLTRSTLQTDVEVKLRQAGIRVLGLTDMVDTELAIALGSPFLYLRVVAGRVDEFPLYAVSISLELSQQVMLNRKTTIGPRILVAPTWRTSWVGVVGTKMLHQVRESVRDQVDQFVNAYLAANPKR